MGNHIFQSIFYVFLKCDSKIDIPTSIQNILINPKALPGYLWACCHCHAPHQNLPHFLSEFSGSWEEPKTHFLDLFINSPVTNCHLHEPPSFPPNIHDDHNKNSSRNSHEYRYKESANSKYGWSLICSCFWDKTSSKMVHPETHYFLGKSIIWSTNLYFTWFFKTRWSVKKNIR